MRALRQIGALGVLLCGWLSVTAAFAQEPALPDAEALVQAQLLDGVRAFRAEQFESALLYFRRVEQQSARPDIGMYLGMVLHKLGRHAEALAAFRSARRALVQESVADYYDAVSCYRLGLYERSRVGFAALLLPRDAPGVRRSGHGCAKEPSASSLRLSGSRPGVPIRPIPSRPPSGASSWR